MHSLTIQSAICSRRHIANASAKYHWTTSHINTKSPSKMAKDLLCKKYKDELFIQRNGDESKKVKNWKLFLECFLQRKQTFQDCQLERLAAKASRYEQVIYFASNVRFSWICLSYRQSRLDLAKSPPLRVLQRWVFLAQTAQSFNSSPCVYLLRGLDPIKPQKQTLRGPIRCSKMPTFPIQWAFSFTCGADLAIYWCITCEDAVLTN